MQEVLEKVLPLIEKKEILKIRKIVFELPISSKIELFDLLSEHSEISAILFFRFLETEVSSEIFSHLDDDKQLLIVNNLTKKETSSIVKELYADEVADLIEDMPSSMKKMILSTIDKTTRIKVNELMKYDDEQIGSFMSVDLVLLKENDTNKTALDKIRLNRKTSELVHYFFIVDSSNKLLGSVSFEDVVFSHPESLVKKNLRKVSPLYTHQDKEEASIIFAKEDMSVLPVLDKNDVILGMLTADEVIDIMNEEATEDIYKNVGISTKDTESYLKQSIFSIVKSRIFWLIILMIGATLTQLIIDKFGSFAEDQLATVMTISSTALLALVPVVSGVSGNSGSQSASTITRAIALGETNNVKHRHIILKEFQIGSAIGGILFVINFLRLIIYYLISGDLLGKDQIDYLLLSFSSSIALFICIIFSKLFGASIPLLAYKFKKDPAVLSSPILTTLIDSLSTFVFYGVSILVLIYIF